MPSPTRTHRSDCPASAFSGPEQVTESGLAPDLAGQSVGDPFFQGSLVDGRVLRDRS
jgi:hypothetical protein